MPFHGGAANNQWAVVWLRVGTRADGQPVVSSVAQEVECRWDDTFRTVDGPDGQPTEITATASGLPFDVPVGSAMAKGRIADLAGTAQTPATDALRVVTFSSEADWRGRDFDREAGLARAADVLGAQA